MNEILFVNYQKPGQLSQGQDANAARRHARKAVIRDRGSSEIGKRLKQYYAPDKNSTGVIHESGSGVTDVKNAGNESTEENQVIRSANSKNPHHEPTINVRLHHLNLEHPYTSLAAGVVPLSVDKIDALFKSQHFQHAAEPLFNTSHIDSDFRMDVVFPGCFQSPSFLNALVFSVVKTASRGQCSPDSLRLQSKVLFHLRETVTTPDKELSPSDIGTILILQGTAYRWNDTISYEAHSKGLASIMQRPELKESSLTNMGVRAVFWQDLFASLLINSKLHESYMTIPQVQWRRQVQPLPLSTLLPKGFIRHQKVLPIEVLDCIQDIIELQETLSNMKSTSSIDRLHLSNMQASIESRLASEETRCKNMSPVAECCRIAALILCFLSFAETWANPLIPCRLSDQLRVTLHESITDVAWVDRRDLQRWVVLVGSYTTSLNRGMVADLDSDWLALAGQLRTHGPMSFEGELKSHSVDSVLHEFVYCDGMVQERLNIPAWLVQEVEFVAGSPP